MRSIGTRRSMWPKWHLSLANLVITCGQYDVANEAMVKIVYNMH